MAEQRWHRGELNLEQALRDLGNNLAYPATPDLAARLRRRLAAEPPPRQSLLAGLFGPRRLAYALVLALAILGGLFAVWPEARVAVAERLGLRGVSIFHVPQDPTPPAPMPPPTALPAASSLAAPIPSPTAPPLGLRLGLGQRVSAEQAAPRAGFQIPLPMAQNLGQPDEVYVGEPPLGGQIALVYYARPELPPARGTGVGLLLTAFRGDLDPAFYAKAAGPGTRIEELTIDGERAVWLEGRPHLFLYRNRAGQVADETVRLAGNVLLWERGDLTLRLEATIEKAEALAIAASVR